METHHDTQPKARERYRELISRLTPAQRFDIAARLSDSVRELAVAGIRKRFPDADSEEIRVRLAVRLYGRAVAARLFEDVPVDAR